MVLVRRAGVAALAIALLLPACASREDRVAGTLMDYGLDRSRAECVAGSLVANLDTGQLKELGRVAKLIDHDERDLDRVPLRRLMRHLRGMSDPAIVAALARAGVGCAVLG
jgi:hypothetical protein